MVRQCAWCRECYGFKEPLEDTSVTHGICLSCQSRILREAGVVLQSNQPENSGENSLEFVGKMQ